MERITRFRVGIMLLLISLVLLLFILTMFDLQVIQTGGKTSDNMTTFTTMTIVKAARGDITDRNGNLMVGSRASYDLVINHFVLTSANNTNQHIYDLVTLCGELGIAYNDHFPMTKERPFEYTLENYNVAWQGYFQTYISNMDLDSDVTAPLLMNQLRRYYNIPEEWPDDIARAVIGVRYEMSLRGQTNLPNYVFLSDASDEARSAILELNVPGMNVESSVEREYYTTYAAHILGSVGKITADQWEFYKENEDYSMDNDIGQSGLELAFEEELHGVDGIRIDTVTADGTVIESYYEKEPRAGGNVECTIDLQLQMVAEEGLRTKIEALRATSQNENGTYPDGHDAEGGAVVCMDPYTGEILACASYPTYDLANIAEKWDEIMAIPYNAMYNRALDAAYPPGSVIKPCMAVAGIDSGTITATEEIKDMGAFTKYEGFDIECISYKYGWTHGMVNATKAIQVSCNYYFYELGDRMRLSVMDSAAKEFGLGEPTGVEIPEEVGHRANEETKKMLYGEEAGFYQGDQILAAIGQSDQRFTPLQLCVYASTLATRGVRYKATFLRRVVSADYRELLRSSTPKILNKFEISDAAYDVYVEGMRLAVSTEEGTSTVFAGYEDATGIGVAGKTGTADTDLVSSANASFICFAPYDKPKLSVAIYCEKAGHGSELVEIAKSIVDTYFADYTDTSDTTVYENTLN